MKFVFSILWLIILTMSLHVHASEYHYDNYGLDSERWQLPRTFYFNLDDKYLLDPTGEYFDLSICSLSGYQTCLKSGLFQLFIKEGVLKEGENWVANETTFVAEKKLNMQFHGKSQQVYLISNKPNEHLKYQFYYSLDNGLIGLSITYLDDDQTEFYLLREAKGLGASK